jgi:hypothetical protein
MPYSFSCLFMAGACAPLDITFASRKFYRDPGRKAKASGFSVKPALESDRIRCDAQAAVGCACSTGVCRRGAICTKARIEF